MFYKGFLHSLAMLFGFNVLKRKSTDPCGTLGLFRREEKTGREI